MHLSGLRLIWIDSITWSLIKTEADEEVEVLSAGINQRHGLHFALQYISLLTTENLWHSNNKHVLKLK